MILEMTIKHIRKGKKIVLMGLMEIKVINLTRKRHYKDTIKKINEKNSLPMQGETIKD